MLPSPPNPNGTRIVDYTKIVSESARWRGIRILKEEQADGRPNFSDAQRRQLARNANLLNLGRAG
ncbi:MAG: hypothetical protein ACI8XO_001322 [Verrucomicrobiales bacterium]|jgi:hypothetical protein